MKANELLGANVAALFGADEFHRRHIGPSVAEETAMLAVVGCKSRRELVAETIPAAILLGGAASAESGAGSLSIAAGPGLP